MSKRFQEHHKKAHRISYLVRRISQSLNFNPGAYIGLAQALYRYGAVVELCNLPVKLLTVEARIVSNNSCWLFELKRVHIGMPCPAMVQGEVSSLIAN